MDLWEFCTPESNTKFDTSEPFVKNGWKYATNGHVCVRVQFEAPDDDHKKFPPCEKLFKEFPTGEWLPWPTPKYCIQCFGKGTIGCAGGNEWCESCGGYEGCGIRKCRMCGGKEDRGDLADNQPMDSRWIGFHLIYAKYDALIHLLPNAKFLAGVKPANDFSKPSEQNWLPFVFDGGQGIIMPLKPGCFRPARCPQIINGSAVQARDFCGQSV